jgi:hypothetical protein
MKRLGLACLLVVPACASSGGDSFPPGSEAGVTVEAGAADATSDAGGLDASPADVTSADAKPVDAADAGEAGEAGAVDTSWAGRPPATPLIVRGPYLSTWLAGDSPSTAWPSFWNGATKAVTGMARIDGTPFVFLGAPAGLTPTPAPMGLVSRSMTPTRTELVFAAGGVALTVDFLSPVEPGDLRRQSAPLGYVTASVTATDQASHAVSLYFDISGEWAHGDSTQQVAWARESVPHAGGSLVVQGITPSSPQPLVEVNQYPAWGTAFLATDAASTVTTAIGQDTVVRSLAASTGALDGTVDTAMPRAIDDRWPVLGFAFDVGQVGTSPSSPVTLVVGHARDPAVSYLGTAVSPLWKAYWSTWEAMVADAYDDAAGASARAGALDARIVSDALAAGGAAGANYAALCTLGLRQAFGGTELVGTAAQPWLMLKEISSDGNVSTVDVIYPASPAFLYTNPLLVKLMVDPLLAYAESGHWPLAFAEHDLGAAYPVAAGHDDGGGENMPIEETANMVILMAAYAQRAKPADAQSYATAHYAIAKKWADYLAANTLDPGCQNQTDDFTGPICHSVNLALKGIVGVGAMSILAGAAGNTADQMSYLGQAQTLIAGWATKAQDTSGKHLLLEYDVEGQWSLKYNAFYDRVLGLNLVPPAILAEETAWYASQAEAFGVPLDPRNTYTKSDWELWTAGALDDPSVRKVLIDGVYGYATTSTSRVPFGDLYYPGTGQWDAFQARPVQGGMFTLLARQGASIIAP